MRGRLSPSFAEVVDRLSFSVLPAGGIFLAVDLDFPPDPISVVAPRGCGQADLRGKCLLVPPVDFGRQEREDTALQEEARKGEVASKVF